MSSQIIFFYYTGGMSLSVLSISDMHTHDIQFKKLSSCIVGTNFCSNMNVQHTVYEKENNRYEYYISMEKDTLNQYDDNGGKEPRITVKEVGTEVTFTQLNQFSKKEIIERIKMEFFWFLELNRGRDYKILIDDTILSYEDFVIERINFKPEAELVHEYEINIVQWNQSLGKEFSKFYYINSEGKEQYKEATKLNKKSDEFYHSIFIKSRYFDHFFFEREQ